MNTIGTRLAQARRDKKLTMQALATLAGCGYQTVMHYEYDIHIPRADILADICKVLNVSIDYIVNGKEFTYVDEETSK